jgi:hypothetical protein
MSEVKKSAPIWRHGCISKYTVANNLKKDMRVDCLKCDEPFKGRVNVRICDKCKGGDLYKDYSLLQEQATEVVY